MGHIWLIYGLYMGYLTEYAMVKALRELFENLSMYLVIRETSLQSTDSLYLSKTPGLCIFIGDAYEGTYTPRDLPAWFAN